MAKNAKNFEKREWGNFTVLNELKNQGKSEDVVIKRLEVAPGKRLSYQTHKLRDEHWFVVSAQGFAVINDEYIPLFPGVSVDIKIGDRHRLDNKTGTNKLIVFEIITGSFDEHDIERIEDDFGRDSSWQNQ